MVVSRGFIKLSPEVLSPSAEETFDSIDTLGSRLRILLGFLTVIGESVSRLLACLLHLRFESVIDALTLGYLVVEALGAIDGLHGHIGTQGHTLMDMTSRG